MCEHDSNTLYHINRVKLFAESSAMVRLRDILKSWGPGDPPPNIFKRDSFHFQCRSYVRKVNKYVFCLFNNRSVTVSKIQTPFTI